MGENPAPRKPLEGEKFAPIRGMGLAVGGAASYTEGLGTADTQK